MTTQQIHIYHFIPPAWTRWIMHLWFCHIDPSRQNSINGKCRARPPPHSWDSSLVLSVSLILVFSLYPWPPFLPASVIWNNLTASLDSFHQSRKKPALTLIKKKKYHLCLAGVKGVIMKQKRKKRGFKWIRRCCLLLVRPRQCRFNWKAQW